MAMPPLSLPSPAAPTPARWPDDELEREMREYAEYASKGEGGAAAGMACHVLDLLVRAAELRGVRVGLAAAVRAAEYQLDQYKKNAAMCDSAGNTHGGTVDTACGLACERVAEMIRAIDPASVAVSSQTQEDHAP